MTDTQQKIANMPPLDLESRDDACFRARDRAWIALVETFDHYHRNEGLTYESLGRRIKRTRAQVQRWLANPFNMNLKSLGLLAEGMDADLIIKVVPRQVLGAQGNYCHPREAARATASSRGIETGTTSHTARYSFTNLASAASSGSKASAKVVEHV